MNYTQTLEFLFNALPEFQRDGSSAYKPGLERTAAFNRYLGNPDRTFFTVHVAGTNGKGSVAHIIASVLQSAGYRVGLYTSPHLKDFRERIRVDGEMISEQEVIRFTERHHDRMTGLGLSFFEMTTGMAFDHFARHDVEVAVVETGLGGRLDSTNIVQPLLSIITNIGMDHMALLGDTIAKIAAEKAGIIKPGVPVVIGESGAESDPVFEARAAETGSSVLYADRLYRCVGAVEHAAGQTLQVERIGDGRCFDIDLDLLGDYQRRNILTAVAALDYLDKRTRLNISSRAFYTGCRTAAASTGLRGRWEVLGRDPLVVCDTGHNAHGLRLVAEQIRRQHYDRLYMVLGVVNDKDLTAMLPLLPKEAHYIFTRSSVNRALSAEVLAGQASHYGLHGEVVPGVQAALARARELARPGDMIFVGGSSFTVADL